MSRYCVHCHGTNEQKGDRGFDNLPTTVDANIAIAERWQEILHQLQLGEMPPSDEKQPTDDERRTMIAWIETQVTQAQTIAQDRGGRVVHRRLNRAEYLNTVRDIFGFEGEFDPTTSFPGDEELEGFRNIGSALRTSRHHLEKLLQAADVVLGHAYDLADVNGKPEVMEWKDSAEKKASLNPAFGLGVVSEEKANCPAYIHLSHGLRNQELIFDSKLFLSKLGDTGVPHSGWYDVEVEATAANRQHPYGKDLMLGGLVPYYKDLKSYYDESQPMQLGTRISCFLTAGPSDQTLRLLAAKGPLDVPTIRSETDRMLDSSRGDRFLRLFTEQWLGLNKLGAMPPAKESFPSYHIDRLEPAMKEETWRFIAELIRTDKPVTAIVDANFTYLNAGLARLYGLPTVNGDRLQRIDLPEDSSRRGLLGHASVLTITANGVETSPVKRGVWVLEKLLGTPPSPPPPDVPPIEPDIRGATTIRQQ